MRPLVKFLLKRTAHRRNRKKAQTLVEYALVLAVISIVAVGVMSALSLRVISLFSSINDLLDTAQGSV